jgi:hypothetical protein|tara:strand:- start:443 stop:682 length:240 start_codon:yes stop_codon:yes gene_type:complete
MIKLLNTDGNMAVQAKEANTVAQLRQFVATESAKSFKSFSLLRILSPGSRIPSELRVRRTCPLPDDARLRRQKPKLSRY